MFPNQDLGIHVLVANFKTKVHVAILCAKNQDRAADITDAIDESWTVKIVITKWYWPVIFNIDMGTEHGREFCKNNR
ncbi:hypothetical protein CEXT_535411 [Caerostris extrusa]|uniref:Transposase n=1 Tax=Caerostris extrusa TaxID=172846 RepID=A0AAV4MZK1_CAEEX|nr:hypothetical protein CEXT_535411 [Caerostris extrusa]